MTNPEFKWKHFTPEIILWCLRWYGSTPMSYANLSDMLAERGISVNRSTIYPLIICNKPHKSVPLPSFCNSPLTGIRG
jgi:transposase-like protein